MDMVGKGVIERDAYREGRLVPSDESHIQRLLEMVAGNWEMRNAEWRTTMIQTLFDIQLNGKNGLKDRSGLLEFRYDT